MKKVLIILLMSITTYAFSTDQVLILNSYTEDFYFTEGQSQGIREALSKSNSNTSIIIEYMGLPRSGDLQTVELVNLYSNFFIVKYVNSNTKFDTIFCYR